MENGCKVIVIDDAASSLDIIAEYALFSISTTGFGSADGNIICTRVPGKC